MKTILSAFLLICCSLISQAQVYPVNANLEDEKSFSMILLPDPQSYIKFAASLSLIYRPPGLLIILKHFILKMYFVQEIW